MIRKAVYPASLDPIHNGHIDIAVRASKMFDEVVVAVYGEPKKTILFTVHERLELAETAFKGYDNITVAQYSGLTVIATFAAGLALAVIP